MQYGQISILKPKICPRINRISKSDLIPYYTFRHDGQPQQQLHLQQVREQAQAVLQRLDAAQNDEEKADAQAALRRATE